MHIKKEYLIGFGVALALFFVFDYYRNKTVSAEPAAVDRYSISDTIDSIPSVQSPEQLKASLLLSEASRPLAFLRLTDAISTPKQVQIRHSTWFRKAEYGNDGSMVEGGIANRASVAAFKDVLLRVNFLSESRTVIAHEDHRIYKLFPPGDAVSFNLHVYPPEDAPGFSVEILRASAVY